MQTMSVEFQSQQPPPPPPTRHPSPHPASTSGQVSRSSISTIDSESQLQMTSAMTKRWTTLEVAGRLMFLFSVVFLVVGILSTVFGFVDVGLSLDAHLPLQITGPVCLATTAVMWLLGAVFFRLWKMEWRRRQQALELRARVQLHAMAMDILKKPAAAALSPRVLQDPRLRRQMLMRLRQQNALDVSSSVDTTMSRRSSRAASIESRRQRDSIVSALLRQELERRRSKELTTCEKLLPTFELPGIQISRIETMDFDDGSGGGGVTGSSRGGSKRYIIIHSDLSSDFSQLSFTSEHSLSGSRSSKSRSSRASSNVSSRLWDFSPRESEWDADVSLGSRESQLSVSKQDWGGGPSYGACRDYSLLSPSMPRKGSVVTFDMGEPPRRHSSPAPSVRRKSISTDTTPLRTVYPPPPPPSALKTSGPRFSDEYRTLDQFRKRSAGDQSIISIRIDEDDGDEEEEEEEEEDDEEEEEEDDETAPLNSKHIKSKDGTEKGTSTGDMQDTDAASVTGAGGGGGTSGSSSGVAVSERRRASLMRNNTDDSEVERRVARIFHEIEYSVTDSVDESKIHSHSSADAAVVRVEAQTQTLTAHELLQALQQSSVDTDPPVVQTGTATSTGPATTTTSSAPSSSEPSTETGPESTTTTGSRTAGEGGGQGGGSRGEGEGAAAGRDDQRVKSSGGSGSGGRFRLLSSLPGAFFAATERRPTTSAGHLGCRMEPTTPASSSASAASSSSAAAAAATAAAVTSSLKSKRLFVQLGFRD